MFQKEENEKDIRLAIAWQKGDKEAGEELLLKYMPLIMRASFHNYTACSWEDLRQELILTFLDSAKNYSPIPNVPFAAFIKKKILWKRKDKVIELQFQEAHETLTLDEQEEPFYEMDMLPVSLPDLKTIGQIAHLTRKQQLIFPFWLVLASGKIRQISSG